MECLFYPELNESLKEIIIEGTEFKHTKALRLKINEKIMITNGKGLSAIGYVINSNKSNLLLNVINYFMDYGENKLKVSLAIGVLNDRERFSFAIEKAVELGVFEIFPIITQYSQPRNHNISHLQQKAIAAMKQSNRSYLPKIYNPIKFNELVNRFDKFNSIILFDESGNKPNIKKFDENLLILLGTEGGFSENELKTLIETDKIEIWNLGSRRLRTETAAISALNIVNFLLT